MTEREKHEPITLDTSDFIRFDMLTIIGAVTVAVGILGAFSTWYISQIESRLSINQTEAEIYREAHRVEVTQILERKADIESTKDRYTNKQALGRDEINALQHSSLKEARIIRDTAVDRELDQIHNDIASLMLAIAALGNK